MKPSAIDRKQYGDLAEDIVMLRSDGIVVCKYRHGFRIDASPEIYDAGQITAEADRVRAKRRIAKERKTAPETPSGGGEDTVTTTKGDAMESDHGGPSAEYSKEDVAQWDDSKRAAVAAALIRSGARNMEAAAMRASAKPSADARIAALEARVAASEAAFKAYKATVQAAVRDLVTMCEER